MASAHPFFLDRGNGKFHVIGGWKFGGPFGFHACSGCPMGFPSPCDDVREKE